ncbi:MAG TPA: acetate/propionate family kinase [Baekduia sp.]|nr:acetate/propionate family kinase [Baekduia sp.]
MRVLVVNAGSSSLKLSLLDADDATVAERELAAPRARVDAGELEAALRDAGMDAPDAVGHRVVHGGDHFHDAVVLDARVEAALRELADLAPLHQGKSLAGVDAVGRLLPGVPAVACFDTAFHATLPDAAATYALPAAWRERWNLRRFGFHGLSHAWVARRVPGERVVSCHLGAGASLCAIRDGRSVDTTMGFTPLEGLVMATRSGNVDPGLVLWLLEHEGMATGELADALEHESGLLGLAGTADLRAVLERAGDGDGPAQLARDVYVHRLRAGIAAMAASLGGLDDLVFTGRAGERSAELRALTAAGLAFLGVGIDDARNAQVSGDAEITAEGAATVRTHVVVAREDLEIARQVRAALAS